MTRLPRLLTIMGSGETTPTMSRVHRSLLDRLGARPVPAVVLDTPYGFQENADDITARAVEYFRDSVGNPLAVASFRSGGDDLRVERASLRIREASYVFSGPGSPTYALRVWAGTDVPRLLAEKIANGGAVTVASAAALTLGRFTMPVYEIYKAGEDPHWLDGLDLLSAVGLPVAVLPHYDNAEGGNHDTRFCFLGERRLRVLEQQLPDEVFVLGVDGHTALVLDLDAGTATVLGQGTVTVRSRGQSRAFRNGTVLRIEELATTARHLAASPSAPGGVDEAKAIGPEPGMPEVLRPAPAHPLAEEVSAAEAAFAEALADCDAARAVSTILGLQTRIVEWSRDTEESTVLDDARAALRRMIVRLGEAAETGFDDPLETLRPLVDALVELRLAARSERDWASADSIRDRLLAAGVELHDGPQGTTWEIRTGDREHVS